MSLLNTLGPRALSLTFDHHDGRYAVTASSPPQYPLSALRDLQWVPSRPPANPSPVSSASSDSSSSRSYDKYPLPDLREVSPGMLASGQLTDNHPLVNTYIDALARIMPRAPAKSSSSSLTSPAAPAHHLPHLPNPVSLSATAPLQPPDITHWLANHAGIASILTLSNVISQQFQLFPDHTSRLYASEVPKLSDRQKEAILALAALKVLNHPEHPAHFALWAKNILRRTAQVVDSVLQLKPSPVASRVGWIGLPENVWALEGLQSIYIPPAPHVQKKSAGMTLRKRKAALAATASLSQTPDDDVAQQPPPRKRVRPTRASQRVKDAQAAQSVEGAPEDPEPSEEDQSTSLLFSTPTEQITPAPFVIPATPTRELITRAVKEEFITSSPVLQAIELMLGLTDSCTLERATLSEPPASEVAPRRSTRPRRKPAPPGTPSPLSTPLSTLSTPPPPALSPSPLPGSEKRTRSHSRGSSTAVSDAGYPSEEGTVIDFGAISATNGKRKAADIEEADFVEEPAAMPQVNSNSKAKKAKSRAPARKRTKVEVASSAEPALADAVSEAGGKDVPEISPVPAVKKRRTSGGKRKAARKA